VTTFIVGEPYDTKARRKGLELVTLEPLKGGCEPDRRLC
jgi:hypothetical protein